MNATIRKSQERGYFDHGWLKTYHTFNFGDYYDSRYTGFKTLRVINEDQVMPDSGFGMHAHRNMEIITYIIEGSLAHKDSLGNTSVLRTNELQLMHAGTGITHSEYNPSTKDPVHFLQIWLTPDVQNVTPGYSQVMPHLEKNALTLIAAKEKAPLTIYQEAKVYLLDLEANKSISLPVENSGYLQIIKGTILLDNTPLDHGDGAAFTSSKSYTLIAKTPCLAIYFSL